MRTLLMTALLFAATAAYAENPEPQNADPEPSAQQDEAPLAPGVPVYPSAQPAVSRPIEAPPARNPDPPVSPPPVNSIYK